MEIETKKWYQSKAVWGGIVAILSGLAGLVGVNVDEQTQEDITNIIIEASSIIGGVLAIYGRMQADKRVEL